MIHPFFKLAVRRPDLLAEHAANYAGLVKSEAVSFGIAFAVKALGAVIVLVALLLALSLTGIAIMLGAIEGSFHWILVLVPALAWLLAALGAALALRPVVRKKVEDVKDEVAIDLRMLRLIKEIKNE